MAARARWPRGLAALAVCCGLVGSSARGACKAQADLRNRTVAVVSHHKSGTFASFQLLMVLCSKGPRVWTRACCAKNGVWASHPSEPLYAGAELLARNDVVVHFIRHPWDMLLSGYRYHQGCRREKWLHATNLSVRAIFPRGAAALFERHVPSYGRLDKRTRRSYCLALSALPPWEGLRLEALRTLGALDGVGRMLRLLAAWAWPRAQRRAHARTVVPMCMATYMPTAPSGNRTQWTVPLHAWLPVARVLGFSARAAIRAPKKSFEGHSTHGGAAQPDGGGQAQLCRDVSAALDYALNVSEPGWPAHGVPDAVVRAALFGGDGTTGAARDESLERAWVCPSQYFDIPACSRASGGRAPTNEAAANVFGVPINDGRPQRSMVTASGL